MTVYHVNVERRAGWFIGRVLERPGVTTEGRTLEELVAMLRDAIEAVWGEKQVQLELLVSSEVAVGASRRKPRKASA